MQISKPQLTPFFACLLAISLSGCGGQGGGGSSSSSPAPASTPQISSTSSLSPFSSFPSSSAVPQNSSSTLSSAAPLSSMSSSSTNTDAGVLFSEDFESTAVNTQPAGWSNLLAYNLNATNTTTGANYALVDTARAHGGSKAIHFKGNFAQILRPLPAGTQRLHMRAWVNSSRQIGNIPGGDNESNHSHIMGIKKTTDANNEIRVGEIKGVLGTNQVPSDDIAPRSDKWRKGPQISANTWSCVEVAMYGDTAYDQLKMWVDGTLVHSITSSADWQNSPQPADWLSDKFNYVEFGFQSYTGQQTADVWMDDLVVSTQPIGCGTTPPVNTSSAVSTSVSSTASSAAPGTGSVANGKALYELMGNNCVLCHGEKGNGNAKINPSKPTYAYKNNGAQSLEKYIDDWMPDGAPGFCDAACAKDIAAYIRSWAVTSSSSSTGTVGGSSSSLSSTSIGNAPGCDVTYGARSMRVLTKNEYISTIKDLTGIDIAADLGQSTYDAIPADNLVNSFSNNVIANIESGSLQSYSLIATKIADLLATRNFSNVVDCATVTGAECHARFVDGFGLKTFRRPLTEAERNAYSPLFTPEFAGADIKDGIKLAVRAMLTSPQFLYRSEVGVSITDIESGTSSDPEYEATGTVQAMAAAVKTYKIYANFGTSVNYTGEDLISVEVKGTQNAGGLWPTMKVEVDNKPIATVLVNHTYAKTYKFFVKGVTGNRYTAISNAAVQANMEYVGGHDLIVSAMSVSGAKVVVPTKPPVVLDRDAYVLTPYEMAGFLSYTFAGTTPDATLLAAAASGGLDTNAQVAAQVERLLKTPQAHTHFGNYAAQWLHTDKVLNITKDATTFPGFTNDVRKAMAQEVRDIFNHVVVDQGEPFTTLYDGSFTFVNQALASFYGIPGVSGNAMRKVENVNSRAGLITSGAFLTVNAHEKETAPILRSVYARRIFMCHYVTPPPTGVSLTDGTDVDALREAARVEWEKYLAANGGKATSRKKYEFQTSASLCASCHTKMINPLGGGFEDFDAVGLPQTKDYNQLTIDSTGMLYGVNDTGDGQTIAFNGAKEFAHEIAGLDVTRKCFIDNGFRLAMGTGSSYFDLDKLGIKLSNAEKTSYSCEVNKLDNVMKNSSNNTKEFFKALGTLDSIRYRKNVTR